MRSLLSVLTIFLVAFSAYAATEITNIINWQPGVRSGIPYYPSSITVTGAVGDGIANDYQAITNAMRRCTNGGAVDLPAGTYRISSELNFLYPTQIVLRGAGPSLTKIITDSTGGDHGAVNFGIDTTRVTAYATNALTVGTTNLILTSTAGMAIGNLLKLSQTNDPAKTFGYNPQSFEQSQMFNIIGISGNTVTVDRPLYDDYSQTYGPFVQAFTKATKFCGLENLTVEMLTNATTKINPVYFYVSQQCWITNCVITNGPQDNISIHQSYAHSIVGSRMENHQNYTTANRYGVIVTEYSSDCLVEDNIIQGNNAAVICQWAAGNVVGYNFSDRGFYHDGVGDATYPDPSQNEGGGYTCHGYNARFNLFEGNVCNLIGPDDTWSQNNRNTFFRNWATRFSYYNPTNFSLVANQGNPGVYNDATNWFQNFVGNIIGSPRDSNDTAHTSILIGTFRSHGSGSDGGLALSKTTLIGNFDWRTNGTLWPSGVQTLTNSYYQASKPGWFGTLRWPAIGSDIPVCITSSITNYVSNPLIPAVAKYYNINISGETTAVVPASIASGVRAAGANNRTR